MMHSSPVYVEAQPRRSFKTLFLALVGVAAVCACLFHSGALSAPVTGSSVRVDYVQSQLEKETADAIVDMAAKAQSILADPAKLQILAHRIQKVMKDPNFLEKMKMEMAKLQNDEEFYAWLALTQGPEQQAPRRLAAAFQVQPAFRGAPSAASAPSTSLAPRVPNTQMQFAFPAGKGASGGGKKFDPEEFAKTLPGITEPLGFFDPLGFCSGINDEKAVTEGKVRFYREVELKHCRVAMLAALGYPLAEQFHPLFGGDIDTPSFTAFQATPLETWWGIAVFAVAIPEIFSVFTFNDFSEEPWSIRSDHKTGELAYLGTFDPLGLKPEDPAELKEMQTKELNNGRLAMIAIAGMVAQEAVTGGKLF